MSCRRQRGAALVIAMIFLIVMTILGIGVVGTTTTEEKLARNFRDMDISFAATEAALRDGEVRINGFFKKPGELVAYLDTVKDKFEAATGKCEDGFCLDAPQPVYQTYPLTGSPAAELGTTTGTPEIALVSEQPRYLIESMRASIPGEALSGGATAVPRICRITATGHGRLTARLTLQETYRHGNPGDPCF